MEGQARYPGLTPTREIRFLLVTLSLLGVLFVGYQILKIEASGRTVQNAPAPVIHQTPHIERKSVSLLPGQEYTLINRSYGKIEVHADYPIRIVNGDCHDDYAVQFNCDGEPSSVFITDLRHMPLFGTPRANSISITATEF